MSKVTRKPRLKCSAARGYVHAAADDQKGGSFELTVLCGELVLRDDFTDTWVWVLGPDDHVVWMGKGVRRNERARARPTCPECIRKAAVLVVARDLESCA